MWQPENLPWLLLRVAGTVLLIVGLTSYATAKWWHAAWGLMGLLSIIGLVVLALLKDHSGAPPTRRG